MHGALCRRLGFREKAIQHLLWRSSFSSWGERQRNPRFLEWGNGLPGRSQHSAFRGMDRARTFRNQLEQTWQGEWQHLRLEWPPKWRCSEINQSITSYWFYPLTFLLSILGHCPIQTLIILRLNIYLFSNHRRSAVRVDFHGSHLIKDFDFWYAKQMNKWTITFLFLQNLGSCKSKCLVFFFFSPAMFFNEVSRACFKRWKVNANISLSFQLGRKIIVLKQCQKRKK